MSSLQVGWRRDETNFKDKLQEGKEGEDEDENTLDDISGDEVSAM